MEFIAFVVVKLVSFGGIGALVSGLFIRSLGVSLSVAVGFALLDTTLLGVIQQDPPQLVSWITAITACCIAGSLGWAPRGRKT